MPASPRERTPKGTNRRKFLKHLSLAGAGAAALPGALTAAEEATKGKVTKEMLRDVEWISGVPMRDGDRAMALSGVQEDLEGFAKCRAVPIDNGVLPATRFSPIPAGFETPQKGRPGPAVPLPAATRPASDVDLAFASVAELASLLKARKVSSVELTKLFLARLAKHDPILQCVVTKTDELALAQAAKADREIASGRTRGPLHGVPWVAKDLIAVPGFPTTWGSALYKTQRRPELATVAARLEKAGAVLIAKTSVGELAWGDVWFGGTTKNPWKTDQGSSGSSAGSASAVAAGLAGFGIGTETLGSIVSPCTRCGTSGLRPTFGRVSRFGVMSLTPSMDKVGPIARSIADCGLIFQAIEGRDPLDPVSLDGPFDWPIERKLAELRIGYVPALFDEDRSERGKTDDEKAAIREWQEFDRESLAALRRLGLNLVPIKVPDKYPIEPLSTILTAEAAATFDELTRTGRAAEMVRQVPDAWPNVFRGAQLIPAVEYLRANRIRSLLMDEMATLMKTIDVYVSPTYAGDNLLLTNLTGHPAAVVPNGFRKKDGTPTSITFTGRLFGEAELLAVAAAYQNATGFHRKKPSGFV